MTRTLKPIFVTFILLVAMSFALSGCYTQLSRPRVATTDVYQEPSESAESDDYYYQDEGATQRDTRDVYIYNYYPFYGYTWYDPWYWTYYPHRWAYLGPYPDFWWTPYGPWWTPGWYVGVYHYDFWWRGHYRYYDSYYWFGGGGGSYTPRHYAKRPFERRSLGAIGRSDESSGSKSSLAKPASQTRPERPHSTLGTPSRDDRTGVPSPSRVPRQKSDTEQQRSREKIQSDEVKRDGNSGTPSREHPNIRQPRVTDQPPRTPRSEPKPAIERQPKATPKSSESNVSQPKRSSRSSEQKSNQISRPSSSGSTHISKPAAPSYTPRSSSSSGSSGTKSTPPSSSSSGSSSSSKSSSQSGSGPSRTSRK